jgi:TolA-binding protein/thiol-disulfide isomerase/thioredoxin
MTTNRPFHIGAAGILASLALLFTTTRAAEAPTAAQALGLTPIQKLVEYSTPTKEDAAQCTNRAEKIGNKTAWVVRSKDNQILRRFADTNSDNVVDEWCYYLDGLEVYRDIDANFNGKADQYRWFHTSGTRWGVDKNEDGRIDAWRTISAHEVGEQVVFALKTRDPARFALLLATPAELNEAGFGKARAEKISESITAAPAEFSKLMEEQKTLTQESRFVDFGSARPAAIAAGTDQSTKDVVVVDNASALVETDGTHEQISLGTLVAIGDTWKLIAAPTIGANAQQQAGFLAQATEPQSTGEPGGAPSEEMQQLMADLEKLDSESASLPEDKQAANVEARAEKLKRLAEISPESERGQWYRQLADTLSFAVQSGTYPQGLEKLDELQKSLADADAGEDAIAHASFQRMWAEYVTNQRAPEADQAQVQQVQQKWLDDLKAFVAKYPKSADAADALLQLGMYEEFVGKPEEASKWYKQLVTEFPNAGSANKAKGALRRIGSVGKPIRLAGNDLQGGKVDLASPDYRRKVVLIHYWATWCEPCKADMVLLKDFYAKKKGGRDFEIIGVCLDNDAAAAKQFLAQERFAWKHLHEPGGLDGRLANEMGIMTPPVMILVDQNGNVVNNNIQAAELEAGFAKLTAPAANAAGRATSLPR